MDSVLPLEIVHYITDLIYTNKDILSFLSISTYYHQLKFKITFKHIIQYHPRLERIPYGNKIRTKYYAQNMNPNEKIPKLTYFLTYANPGPLKPGEIPNSVGVISFAWGFCYPIKKGDIPNSVKEIFFGDRFDFILYPGVIPNSVKKLHFGEFYNKKYFLIVFLIPYVYYILVNGLITH
jgi:hypothetical protein